MGEWLYSPVHF